MKASPGRSTPETRCERSLNLSDDGFERWLETISGLHINRFVAEVKLVGRPVVIEADPSAARRVGPLASMAGFQQPVGIIITPSRTRVIDVEPERVVEVPAY